MTVIFIISDVEMKQIGWKLHHNPTWDIPFVTVDGTHHVWNWDFTSGNLLKDGEPLIGHTILVEKEEPK